MKTAVWWLLDHVCAWTGHELLFCYNRPGPLQRLWYWSLGDWA